MVGTLRRCRGAKHRRLSDLQVGLGLKWP